MATIVRRVAVTVESRECANCGRDFFPPHIKTRGGVVLSKRITCNDRCADQLRGDLSWDSHRKRRQDPAAYRHSQTANRNMSEMGRKRHAATSQ